ncbi:MAG: hypothetical protein Q8Q04_00645 [archaeon]|nr:hypothetical protein [archaeon]
MRNILLRFEEEDELISKIDEVAKKLGNTNSGITKLALFEFCKKILESQNAN